jgi:hypothetical protein
MFGKYVQMRKRVREHEKGLGWESEKWNESVERVETILGELRRRLPQNPEGE